MIMSDTPEEVGAAPRKKKNGRPSKYTPELATEMVQRLSEGEPLRQICRDDHMPEWRTVYDWMGRDQELSAAIARAREIGYDKMAEEVLEIADNVKWGQVQIMDDKGTTIRTEDMLGHRKLQIETRLKLLAKWNPKKYGDKLAVGGDAENPLKVDVDASGLFDQILQSMELAKKKEQLDE